MGREQRRKEEKRNKYRKNIKKQEELDTSIKGTTILKVVSSIVLILLVVYYIMAVFITKEIDISEKNNDAKATDTATVNSNVSNKIIAINIFNQKEDNYYVYCYDFSDEDEGVAQAINGASNQTIYRLNTKDGLNSKYVTEETGNRNATSLDDLKIANPTLLVISADKIVGYYEGRNDIMSFLSQ